MSFEWARARAIENHKHERERARSVLGAAEPPQLDMVYPIALTFWGGQASPLELESGATAQGKPAREIRAHRNARGC